MKRVAVRVEIDPSVRETEVIIRAGEKTALVDDIMFAIDKCVETRLPRIVAYQGDSRMILRQQDIIRIYTENRKLIIHTRTDICEARCPLRELEEILDPDIFIRVSRFELVNIDRIISFDLSLSGTIRIIFENQSITYVARRYVRDIEQRLTRWQK